jgi:sterol desaturase/sphingolipid hydroxylase (fatty acid hydroxylase superfamily)
MVNDWLGEVHHKVEEPDIVEGEIQNQIEQILNEGVDFLLLLLSCENWIVGVRNFNIEYLTDDTDVRV